MRAFAGCTSLTEIDLPDSVSEIGQEAFWGCTGLTRLHRSKGVSFLGGGQYRLQCVCKLS